MIGRIGSVLLLAGAALTAIVVVIGLGGGAVGVADRNSPPPAIGEILSVGAVILFGLGSGVSSLAGSAPLRQRTTRVGLALICIGCLGLAVGSLMATALNVYAESYASILPLIVGFAAGAIGLVLTGASLARTAGWSRTSGLALLGGTILAPALGIASGSNVVVSLLYLLIPLGLAGVGVLGLRSLALRGGAG
jgi:hypothetical protein